LHMLHWARHQQLAPDPVCFNSVISASSRNVRWPVALGLLSGMRRWRAEPTPASHNSAMGACALAQQWTRGLVLLRGMCWRQLAVDIVSYGTVLRACCSAQRWQQASALLHEMQCGALEPDTAVIQDLIAGLEGAGLPQRGLATFHGGRAARHKQAAELQQLQCYAGGPWRVASVPWHSQDLGAKLSRCGLELLSLSRSRSSPVRAPLPPRTLRLAPRGTRDGRGRAKG